jgi:ribosomal protection tetracycline resistance protein
VRTLNLGIVAHVDAGKTSLTERLLYAAGVIDEIGCVDEGTTQTDTLELERQRGITIRSAVVSFMLGDVTVNLIDTPGHPDFIAEVERVLTVLDGAILVVSAVEGVQAQTRILMRTLQRLAIPTLIFVNKVDRAGADGRRVLAGIAERLTQAIVAMGSGTDCRPYTGDDDEFTTRLIDLLADHDEEILHAYVENATNVSYRQLRATLARATKRAAVHPVFFGSAVTGAGVDPLMNGIRDLLPAVDGDLDAPASGSIFKVERGPAGEKIAYVRMFSGRLRTRDRIRFRQDYEAKVTAISTFERGTAVRANSVSAGQIGKLWGLGQVRIGDLVGVAHRPLDGGYFAPPTLETVVMPRHRRDKGALHAALVQLAEQDPLINLRQDDVRGELSVCLYGEVQKEVIQSTLASEYGIQVRFEQTSPICIERVIGSGDAVEIINKAPNPFLATVGLRVEPGAVNSGVEFRLGVELGSMPYSFFKAVEDTVAETLRQGICGWQVTDCVITMTHSGYWPRQSHMGATFDKSMSSTAGDFRNLTPLVLMDALVRAGTRVHEPMHRFHLEVPADTFGTVLPVLARLEAVPQAPAMHGPVYTVQGEIPAARVHDLQRQLGALTRGEGFLECAFERFRPVRGPAPTRARWDHNPLNRKEYLLHVQRLI